ncbi:MAG: hypothetical protein ACYDCQ_15460, partial [Dehalococcoidia bacterium]
KERTALQQMKKSLNQWMNQRDIRILAERPTVDALGQRLTALDQAIVSQRQAFDDASLARRPVNTTLNGQIVDSSHINPRALDYARNLRDLLASSRARLNAALSGRQ